MAHMKLQKETDTKKYILLAFLIGVFVFLVV